MKKRMIIILISIIASFVIMSGGFGLWQETLTISGTIKVLEKSNNNPENESVDTDLELQGLGTEEINDDADSEEITGTNQTIEFEAIKEDDIEEQEGTNSDSMDNNDDVDQESKEEKEIPDINETNQYEVDPNTETEANEEQQANE